MKEVTLTIKVTEDKLRLLCHVMEASKECNEDQIKRLNTLYKKALEILEGNIELPKVENPVMQFIGEAIHKEAIEGSRKLVHGGVYQEELKYVHYQLRMDREILDELKKCLMENFAANETETANEKSYQPSQQ